MGNNVPNHQSDLILINGGMNSCCIHDTITGHRRFTNLTSYRNCICWAPTLSNVLGEWMLDVAASSYLVGGYYSQYMAVSWDDYSQYMGSHNPVIFQTTNQITIILLIFPLLLVYTLWKPQLISLFSSHHQPDMISYVGFGKATNLDSRPSGSWAIWCDHRILKV